MNEAKKKSMSQIDYEIEQLKRERKEVTKENVTKKVDEYIKVFNSHPPKDDDDLRRILMMLAADLKNIFEE